MTISRVMSGAFYTVISDEVRTKWAVRILAFMCIASFAVTWRVWTPYRTYPVVRIFLGCPERPLRSRASRLREPATAEVLASYVFTSPEAAAEAGVCECQPAVGTGSVKPRTCHQP